VETQNLSRTLRPRNISRRYGPAPITASPRTDGQAGSRLHRRSILPPHAFSIVFPAPEPAPARAGTAGSRIVVMANAASARSSNSSPADHTNRQKNIFWWSGLWWPTRGFSAVGIPVPIRSRCRWRTLCSCRFLRPFVDFR